MVGSLLASATPEQKCTAPDMVGYDEAQELLAACMQNTPLLPIEFVSIAQADGRILAEDVRAVMPRPEADISAMDGYAFRCADMEKAGNTGLPLAGQIAAGDTPPPLGQDVAYGILTGARLPVGADCVVAQERASITDGRVHLREQAARSGLNIRRQGEEFCKGDILLEHGQKLDWRHLPILVHQGKKQVAVYKRPKICVVANGAEFGATATDCRTELNTQLLAAMLQSKGALVTRYVCGSDSAEDLHKLLYQCVQEADILITTGGISVGQTDHVLSVLNQMGAKCLFRRVKIRPGKPMTVMQLGQKMVFCLPGNPAAAAICAQLFVVPFLHCLAGEKQEANASIAAEGQSRFSYVAATDTTCFLPVHFTENKGENSISLVPSVGASDILCLTRATGFVKVSAGETLQVGDMCQMIPFTS
ncbi:MULTISPECIES: molybdopterin molybdotransferase MoeA [Acetobacter]|uniref:Molybdopterin molybdenumtransferase n=2 Tax=Acetobacter TaxID=434 RepID=A0AAN1PH84_9PROT|nr:MULTISPECIES: molybdopterin molybdotransferase MoeA [Acetobacter]ASL40435.1 molybdopterin molybdenumtransferase MoeA [Acetobacter oryzifermentans]AXN00223.1 molybdopterin molybdenumtransferase MoeA [Acetobacter pomorum]KAA8393491.1 molybdopterin molybdotransferase MoeA [Acetobacter sp. DmW_125128]KAA8393619.1 molybdopterin molybdotransferase MoeA [Acetobacter sp. DmW_125124]KAA8393928.1 molybdopterin molybdotransferase MoeA [Acetobacter sp. DmW_125127]